MTTKFLLRAIGSYSVKTDIIFVFSNPKNVNSRWKISLINKDKICRNGDLRQIYYKLHRKYFKVLVYIFKIIWNLTLEINKLKNQYIDIAWLLNWMSHPFKLCFIEFLALRWNTIFSFMLNSIFRLLAFSINYMKFVGTKNFPNQHLYN